MFLFLEIHGVGYRASILDEQLCLKLGFSSEIKMPIPSCIKIFCLKPTLICCVGTSKINVTQFAAQIRKLKPPEVYKGKGIRYKIETLIKKQGKKR